MDVREKLVELLNGVLTIEDVTSSEQVADHLLANGVTVQEWISVDDRLPEEKANCIVYYKHAFCDDENHVGICVCFYDGDEFQMDSLHKVTHWMPLPLAPEVKFSIIFAATAERRMKMTIKHDNCKNCSSRCIHAGKDRDFVCVNGVSCKITTEKPQTNADRIRSMSDFELAKEIENAQSGIEIKNSQNIDYFDCILEWLKQPAE